MDFFDHEKFMASLMDIFDEKNHIPFLPPKKQKPKHHIIAYARIHARAYDFKELKHKKCV